MRALIIVDVQNDFLPGGALAVSRGDEIIPTINAIENQFELVIATQDWHPADHGSFAANHLVQKPGDVINLHGLPQVLWPAHCVQGSFGAEFSSDLAMHRVETIFRKGTDSKIDSYSGFFDNGHRKATGLGGYLKDRGVSDVYVCGLATDYCVKFTAMDAMGLGFSVHLIEDACRGVELKPGDVAGAVKEMRLAGVKIENSGSLQ
jgi:nicotinamidase/pyrazinamidase